MQPSILPSKSGQSSFLSPIPFSSATPMHSNQHILDRLDQSLKSWHNDAATLAKRGVVLMALDRVDEAIESFRKAIQSNSKQANALHNLGDALYTKGDYEGAIENYYKTLQIWQNHTTTLHNLGVALIAQGRYGEAEQRFREAINTWPNDADMFMGLGNALISQGRYDEAEDCYVSGLRINSSDPNAHHNLATLFIDQGRYADAQDECKRAIELNRSCPLYFKTLAKAYEAGGDYDKAFENYKIALELESQKDDVSDEPGFEVAVLNEEQLVGIKPIAESQTIKAEVEALNRRNQYLQIELAKAKQKLVQNENDHHRISGLERQMQKILENQQANQSLLKFGESQVNAEKRFHNQPNLLSYRKYLMMKLEAISIGSKAVYSGFIDHSHKGKLGSIAEGISLVGHVVSLVPVLGNAIGGALIGVGKGVDKIDYDKQLKSIIKISCLGTLMEMATIYEEVALELTECYRDQITALKTPSISNQNEDVAKQLQHVAEYGVLKILEDMLYGKIDGEKGSLAKQMIKSVMKPSEKSITERLSEKVGHNTLLTCTNVKWNLFGLYQNPAARTPEGLYGHETSNVELYGYRYLKSSQDAEYFELVRLPGQNPPTRISASPRTPLMLPPIENFSRPAGSYPNSNALSPLLASFQALQIAEEGMQQQQRNPNSNYSKFPDSECKENRSERKSNQYDHPARSISTSHVSINIGSFPPSSPGGFSSSPANSTPVVASANNLAITLSQGQGDHAVNTSHDEIPSLMRALNAPYTQGGMELDITNPSHKMRITNFEVIVDTSAIIYKDEDYHIHNNVYERYRLAKPVTFRFIIDGNREFVKKINIPTDAFAPPKGATPGHQKFCKEVAHKTLQPYLFLVMACFAPNHPYSKSMTVALNKIKSNMLSGKNRFKIAAEYKRWGRASDTHFYKYDRQTNFNYITRIYLNIDGYGTVFPIPKEFIPPKGFKLNAANTPKTFNTPENLLGPLIDPNGEIEDLHAAAQTQSVQQQTGNQPQQGEACCIIS